MRLKLYYITGGVLLFTSAIGFVYFTLLRYDATFIQWLSAIILAFIGGIFLAIGEYGYKRK